MKKVITLCFFVFAMLLGTESITAQTSTEVNTVAGQKTEELRSLLKIDKSQTEDIYNAFKEYGKAHASLVNSKTVTEEAVTKLKKRLNDKMEAILNEEQFEVYKNYIKEQEG